MITYLLVAEKAQLEVTDHFGKKPVDYARENNHTITEQVARCAVDEASDESLSLMSPDIQLFLETFGYVERLDFLNDLRNITRHMSDSLNFVTDELTTSADSEGTDYNTDDPLSDLYVRSRHSSQSHDK